MTSYLVTYHGGGMPETEEGRQQAMAAFGAWVGKVGDALADPGAPLGEARTVSADGVHPGAADGPSPVTRCCARTTWSPRFPWSATTRSSPAAAR